MPSSISGDLEIEQGEVWVLAFDRRHGRFPGLGFRDDYDVVERAQKGRQKRSGGPFVVRDHDAKAVVHAVCSETSVALEATGIRISTVVPTLGSLLITSVAAAP